MIPIYTPLTSIFQFWAYTLPFLNSCIVFVWTGNPEGARRWQTSFSSSVLHLGLKQKFGFSLQSLGCWFGYWQCKGRRNARQGQAHLTTLPESLVATCQTGLIWNSSRCPLSWKQRMQGASRVVDLKPEHSCQTLTVIGDCFTRTEK